MHVRIERCSGKQQLKMCAPPAGGLSERISSIVSRSVGCCGAPSPASSLLPHRRNGVLPGPKPSAAAREADTAENTDSEDPNEDTELDRMAGRTGTAVRSGGECLITAADVSGTPFRRPAS